MKSVFCVIAFTFAFVGVSSAGAAPSPLTIPDVIQEGVRMRALNDSPDVRKADALQAPVNDLRQALLALQNRMDPADRTELDPAAAALNDILERALPGLARLATFHVPLGAAHAREAVAILNAACPRPNPLLFNEADGKLTFQGEQERVFDADLSFSGIYAEDPRAEFSGDNAIRLRFPVVNDRNRSLDLYFGASDGLFINGKIEGRWIPPAPPNPSIGRAVLYLTFGHWIARPPAREEAQRTTWSCEAARP